uniref:Uncharacterized protein n=1 Tax=Haptolina brevifila TaxID=156173 RepID=A0A7S2H4L5_9EUKA
MPHAILILSKIRVGMRSLRRFSTAVAHDAVPAAVAERFAGRYALGKNQSPVGHKAGAEFLRGNVATRVIGGACSEVLGGANLAALLREGFELEARAMAALTGGMPAETLSIHTSAGVPPQLETFIDALAPHLPVDDDDWCLNLQAEGASAVHAAIDMCLQASGQNISSPSARTGVAVGQTSYHGPPSTSPGGSAPLGSRAKGLTLDAQYPVPTPFFRRRGEDSESFYARKLAEFKMYLDEHEHEIAVVLFEPQWGSSAAAMPWPPQLLKAYTDAAKARGLMVISDEIMCGLGRHGHEPAAGGTGCFLAEVWDLQPDAITFGKAIGGGAGHLLSGAALLKGASKLASGGHGTALQSHTYAGSSARALLNGTALLNTLPKWRPNVQKIGATIGGIVSELQEKSGGAIVCHGQGAKWGGIFAHEDAAARQAANVVFKKRCADKRVLPYFVPVGGFMLTPRYDDDVEELRKAVTDLAECALATTREMKWAPEVLISA